MKWLRWMPAALLAVGFLLSAGVRPQLAVKLREPLALAVPARIDNDVATDHAMTPEEVGKLGVNDYVLRTYAPDGSGQYAYSIYVGYYQEQTRGHTIHSPRNCLPGAGWEALVAGTAQVPTQIGDVTVNRHIVYKKGQRMLVMYWYQGRGRLESNEYMAKWNLLRDAALRRRSEAALVRVMVPLSGNDSTAVMLATRVAGKLVESVQTVLPS